MEPNLPLRKLVHLLKQLPGIGEKTALRLSYAILRKPKTYANDLAQALYEASENLRMCKECFNFTHDVLCHICRNHSRNRKLLCVVEEPTDVEAIEKSNKFSGLYHILHGSFSPLEGISENKLKIKELKNRIEREGIDEVILATNPTVEGDTTALFIARFLKPMGIKVSRIGYGIPVGAEIEYLDGATIGKALQNRVTL